MNGLEWNVMAAFPGFPVLIKAIFKQVLNPISLSTDSFAIVWVRAIVFVLPVFVLPVFVFPVFIFPVFVLPVFILPVFVLLVFFFLVFTIAVPAIIAVIAVIAILAVIAVITFIIFGEMDTDDHDSVVVISTAVKFFDSLLIQNT